MRDRDALTCQELVELVTDYLEEALPASERARFEAHLTRCANCPIYLQQLRLTIRLTGTLREEHVPEAAKDELLRHFRDWTRDRPDSPAKAL